MLAAGRTTLFATDGGVHWTPLTDAQPSLAVGSIAIDPSNHSTIYEGTGEENFSGYSYYGGGNSEIHQQRKFLDADQRTVCRAVRRFCGWCPDRRHGG